MKVEMIKDPILRMSELRLATNNFSEENLMKQTPSVVLYKGQLADQSGQSIPIVVRRYTNPDLSFNEAFISFHHIHKNISTLFKVASEELADDDDDWGELDAETSLKLLNNGYHIYTYEVNESLDKHLSGSTLTWIQRLNICLDLARALCYMHSESDGEDQSMIHGNIKSSKILLNHNWEPILHGLRADMMVKKHGVHHPSNYDGTVQYTDPAYEKTIALSHKSDVYSFGVVLFEVLLGRVASIPLLDEDNWSFAGFARSHYECNTLSDIIDPVLRQQMDSQSLKNFSEAAYHCLEELRSQRPDMIQVVKRLERALDLQQKHESPVHSKTTVDAPLSDQLKGKNLDRLRMSLSDIRSATDNFSETYSIGSGGYGSVYRAELQHFNGSHSSSTEGIARDDLPKRKSTVAIKRILDRVDKQGEHGFLAEIELLSNCKHQNVVSLLGFCIEGDEMILVYEHISNGSLDAYLGDHDKLLNLTWGQRLQICLDIAHGLFYLHTSTKDKPTIIHRDIKSANVLLDDNWVAKIGDFGLSKLNNTDQQSRTLVTKTIAGTEVYLDPEYAITGRLKKESDVYSLGVVLFEVMCGRLAYDNIYYVNNEKGLVSVTRRRFNDGTLKDMVDPRIMEADENIFMLNGGLNQDSFDTFTKIANRCVAETQVMRPTMQDVINELQKAINFQKKDNLQISLEDIILATQNFSDDKCMEKGRYWRQYQAEIRLANTNEHTIVAVKRFDSKSDEGRDRFLTEIKVLFGFKHKNIVALVGYCTDMNERIICYEHVPNGRLSKYVQDASLTWMQRINICIDVASGLAFLENGGVTKDEMNRMIHSDIKSGSILLDAEWNAKISSLELASSSFKLEQWKHGGDDYGSLGFMDPDRRNYVTTESDWYSFSRILLEMFCGRSAKDMEPWSFYRDTFDGCDTIDDFIGQVAFKGIKEQISAKSCEIFFDVALQCGEDKDGEHVSERLEKALEAQEDHEIWEPKLPKDYQEILESSKIEKDHDIWDRDEDEDENEEEDGEIEIRKHSKKRLYELLCKGILLKDRTTWVSLGNNRRINEMISARKFVFKKSGLHSWRSTPESRFPKVAEMFIISKIKINIRTQFLSVGVNYGVHLVFKFCGPRKSSSKPSYVNLRYKIEKETFHGYFATWRDEDWMMVELCRFLNHKKDTNFEVLLESFSRYYCERNGIYIEGIEFRAIHDVKNSNTNMDDWESNIDTDEWYTCEEVSDISEDEYEGENVKNEEIEIIEEVQQVLKSNTGMAQVQQLATDSEEISKRSANDDEGEKALSLNEVNEKKHLMLSAKEVLYDSSKVKRVKLFHLKPSEDPRFEEVIELLPQQVFSIKCKIESQKLLPDTEYMCYLVYKLSEKCHGLHCPVKVRDVLHWKNKEIGILYFRTPSPWNIHDNHRVPKKRKDGWMEVIVWKFNSTSDFRDWDDGLIKLFELDYNSNAELPNDYIPMHLKLIAYEGTMSGLIVGGLEIRPV